MEEPADLDVYANASLRGVAGVRGGKYLGAVIYYIRLARDQASLDIAIRSGALDCIAVANQNVKLLEADNDGLKTILDQIAKVCNNIAACNVIDAMPSSLFGATRFIIPRNFDAVCLYKQCRTAARVAAPARPSVAPYSNICIVFCCHMRLRMRLTSTCTKRKHAHPFKLVVSTLRDVGGQIASSLHRV